MFYQNVFNLLSPNRGENYKLYVIITKQIESYAVGLRFDLIVSTEVLTCRNSFLSDGDINSLLDRIVSHWPDYSKKAMILDGIHSCLNRMLDSWLPPIKSVLCSSIICT